jgi:hypothetical protein
MKDAETDPETIAAWAAREPQRGFIECADKLQDRGHSVDALADAMLTVSLMMMHRTHGPQWVAARLVMLADKYHAEAAALRRACAGGDDGLPN